MSNIGFLLNKTVVVKRRKVLGVAPRDELNAPTYGNLETWDTIYSALECRIEISSAPIQFKPTGERVPPLAKLYIDEEVDIKAEDRVIDGDIIYIVQGVQPHYDSMGGIHHYEFDLLIP